MHSIFNCALLLLCDSNHTVMYGVVRLLNFICDCNCTNDRDSKLDPMLTIMQDEHSSEHAGDNDSVGSVEIKQTKSQG